MFRACDVISVRLCNVGYDAHINDTLSFETWNETTNPDFITL